MRKIVFILLFIPVFAVAQAQDVFIELRGIKGEVVKEGFVGCFQAMIFYSLGANHTEF